MRRPTHLRTLGSTLALATALLVGAEAAGCGSGAAGARETEAPGGGLTAGADAPRRHPEGPPPSFLAAGTKVVARVDVGRVRGSPVGPQIAETLRASPTWQALTGRSGADPIQDFDAILVGADRIDSDRRIAVLRHRHTEAELRRRVLQLAIDRGSDAAWRQVDGLAAIAWPVRASVSYSLVMTAEHEIVLAPDDELTRIAEVARDHAARRSRPEAVIEPGLSFREREIATFVLEAPLPRRDGYPEPPQRMRMEFDELDAGGVRIAVHAEFASVAEARNGHEWLRAQAQHWSQQMMLRAIGMHRPIEQARIVLAGTSVDVGTELTTEEVRRLSQLLELSQMMQPSG
jgi:hypothetical protein